MFDDHVNLVKLCVGVPTVDTLVDLQTRSIKEGRYAVPEHVTRYRPRRALEVLNGGSLYWVFRGYIQARQRIVALGERPCTDGITRCAIIFDPEIIRTKAYRRRPFRGWRYLAPGDSPPDLDRSELRRLERLFRATPRRPDQHQPD